MAAPRPLAQLTSGRVLAGSTIWNLAGQLLPLAAAVVAIPILIRYLGVSRFGVLSLAWIVVGYFSLLDLGIGRALTKLVADKLGAQEECSIPPLAWTSLLLLFLLGVFAGAVIWTISPWLVQRVLKIPVDLQQEGQRGFYFLAISIFMVTTTSGLRGILEAQQRFRILTLIRIPMSTFSFAGPLLVLPFSHSLVPVILVLVAGRLIGGLAHLFACLHAMPALRHGFSIQAALIAPLLKLGSWMTVSNIVTPVIVYLDRFLIGALVSVSAVAYYSAPFDTVSRLTIIPGAITGVLFPAFAVSLMQDRERTELLLIRGVKYVFLAVFPIALVIVTVAPEALRLWLGSTFVGNSSAVLRIMAAGVFVNCLANVPFTLIQGAGRPEITAILVLVELPVYFLGLRFMVKGYGIEGAAIAMAGRFILEAAILFFYSHRLLPLRVGFLSELAATVAGALGVFYAATLFQSLATKMAFLLLLLPAFGAAAWIWGLAPEERVFMLRFGKTAPMKVEIVTDLQ